MTAELYDATRCELGEGPLWHPGLGQLFWFDILSRRLHSHGPQGPRHWDFPMLVSAAGWIDDERLLIASERGLHVLTLASGAVDDLCPVEADNPATRSNDGRADPFGGFWFGTMGKKAEAGAGAIYRYHGGELRKLYPGISIPNSLCFSPDGRHAYYADTTEGVIRRQGLDARGWPAGDPEILIDLRAEGRHPDGSVTDAAGNIWNAQWGSARVVCYTPQGHFVQALAVPAAHSSCPAFGGAGLRDLFVTTALENISPQDRAANPAHGQTFVIRGAGQGRPEHRVVLG